MRKEQTDFDVEDFLANLTHRPGVYRMLSEDGRILYVGKARDLKKRVSSYYRKRGQSRKNQLMMAQVSRIEITVTNTEAEALLLENNVIKEYHPRYNILLRDNKSYPYIRVTVDDKFPRLAFYRGSRKHSGRYFGPYPDAGAVRETLNLLHKLFQIRQCRDSFFSNRTRPCLQYQIKRCSAPCVGLVDKGSYRENLGLALEFLSGNSNKVTDTLIARMDEAACEQRYEDAARFRDRVEILRRVTERQYVSSERGDIDIVACEINSGFVCVQVFNVRGGLHIGNKAYHPDLPDGTVNKGELLTAFLGQYYLARKAPHEIILDAPPNDSDSLRTMLETQSGHKVKILTDARGRKRKWLNIAKENAACVLKSQLASKANLKKQFQSLREALMLPEIPMRMECFDVSHTMGEATVASCVVFGAEGALKQEYRRFNIKDVKGGDDYAAMHQALKRRYQRLMKEGGRVPDVLFIDGGKGQLGEARSVLEELGVEGLALVAVAKGAERKPGMETLLQIENDRMIALKPDTPALYLVQQIRDEAHRFAIAGHRRQRAKKRNTSPLEALPGVGPKRRHNLIKHFGGFRGVSRASTEEISKVPGVSMKLAESIYESLHTNS